MDNFYYWVLWVVLFFAMGSVSLAVVVGSIALFVGGLCVSLVTVVLVSGASSDGS